MIEREIINTYPVHFLVSLHTIKAGIDLHEVQRSDSESLFETRRFYDVTITTDHNTPIQIPIKNARFSIATRSLYMVRE